MMMMMMVVIVLEEVFVDVLQVIGMVGGKPELTCCIYLSFASLTLGKSLKSKKLALSVNCFSLFFFHPEKNILH